MAYVAKAYIVTVAYTIMPDTVVTYTVMASMAMAYIFAALPHDPINIVSQEIRGNNWKPCWHFDGIGISGHKSLAF